MRFSSTIIFITVLCVCLSLILCACASQQIINGEKAEHHGVRQPVLLPRKLKVTTDDDEEAMVMKGAGKKDVVYEQHNEGLAVSTTTSSYNNLKESNKKKQEAEKEWMDNEATESEFFTMDYNKIKKRRPVHNKSLPSSSSIDAP